MKNKVQNQQIEISALRQIKLSAFEIGNVNLWLEISGRPSTNCTTILKNFNCQFVGNFMWNVTNQQDIWVFHHGKKNERKRSFYDLSADSYSFKLYKDRVKTIGWQISKSSNWFRTVGWQCDIKSIIVQTLQIIPKSAYAKKWNIILAGDFVIDWRITSYTIDTLASHLTLPRTSE